MAKSNVSSLLTSVDDLFTTQAERDAANQEKVVEIPLDEINDCPNHPFKVRMDEAMMEMADSIRRYGVLVPGMVRPKPEGGYEMVAGHRRKMASTLAQKETMPCLVRNLTDDEAIIIMVDSNLQRESLLPSEKAFAYKMKLEAMKRQAGRPSKENPAPVGSNLFSRSNEELAASSPDGKTQIQRYIRLTYLIPPLLDMVDEGKIAMRPAVELSYLPEKEQCTLHEMMELEDCTPSHAQAIKMRRFAEEGKLSEDVILSIMQEEKPNQKEQFRMPRERISKYFPAGTPAQKIKGTGTENGSAAKGSVCLFIKSREILRPPLHTSPPGFTSCTSRKQESAPMPLQRFHPTGAFFMPG